MDDGCDEEGLVMRRYAGFPRSYFVYPGDKSRADSEGLIDIENADLTAEGLKAKMIEWDEIEHGVPRDIYNDALKRLRKMGERMPSGIRRAKEEVMDESRIARELLIVAKELMAGKRWVREVIKELKELDKLGIDVPRKKMNEREIEKFFSDMEPETMGSRELSEVIDTYLMF